MSIEQRSVDAYLSTIDRLEPDIAAIDASAFYASAAISLKRIADALELRCEPFAYEVISPDGNSGFLQAGHSDLKWMLEKGWTLTPLYK